MNSVNSKNWRVWYRASENKNVGVISTQTGKQRFLSPLSTRFFRSQSHKPKSKNKFIQTDMNNLKNAPGKGGLIRDCLSQPF